MADRAHFHGRPPLGRRSRIAAGLVGGIAGALALLTSGPAAAAPVFREGPCPPGVPAVAAARVQCGLVEVPLRHEDPAAGTIGIAVSRCGRRGPVIRTR